MNSYLVTEWTDPVKGVKGYLAIDKAINGTAGGGIRMREGVTKNEVQRLAHTMTLKLVGLDMPIGGAKAGIDYSPTAPDSKEVLSRFLEAHKALLMHVWGASEDMGTSKDEIVEIVRGFGMTTAVDALLNTVENKEERLKDLSTALNLVVAGVPITDVVTGVGVASAAEKAIEWLGMDVKQSKAAIQGFGSVGSSTAKYLSLSGCKITAVSDIHGTIYHEEGLDIPLLLEAKDAKGNIDRTLIPSEYKQEAGSYWMENEVDVLIPSAVADAIHERNVDDVKAKIIVEGANLPVSPAAEKVLYNKGIYVVPDFIANSAGAGLFGSMLYNGIAPDADSIFTFLSQKVSSSTAEILEQARAESISPREAALKINDSKVASNQLLTASGLVNS